MPRLYVILVLLLFQTLPCLAQDELKMQLLQVVPGSITFNDGKKMDVYIKKHGCQIINGNRVEAKWRIQYEVSFLLKSVFELKEVFEEEDFITIKTLDLSEIIYDEDKYSRISFLDSGAESHCELPDKKYSLLAKVIAEDRIHLYEFFYPPCSYNFNNSMIWGNDKCAEPLVLWNFGTNQKVRKITDLNVKRHLKGCPAVMKKIRNSKYIPKEFAHEPLSKIKFWNKHLKEINLMAALDYNNGICE